MEKAYVFDMDGVLIDSMGYFGQAMLDILIEDGISYPDDIVNIITPLGLKGCAEYFIELGVKGNIEEIINRMGEKMIYLYTNVIKAKPFVKEYLERLKSQDKRLYVLTASPHITVDVCLKNNGIFDLFDEVWSTDDFPGLTKSDTRLFHTVAQTVGCKEDEIKYFDDNIIAVENAGKAGFNTVGVYDSHYAVPKEEVKAASKQYIMSFEELL